MHITQKGQVTIPQHIREKFGLLPHTEVDFMVNDDQVVLKKITRLSTDDQIAALRGSLKGHYNSKELLKLTRG